MEKNNGSIESFQLYNSELTEEEVYDLYKDIRKRFNFRRWLFIKVIQFARWLNPQELTRVLISDKAEIKFLAVVPPDGKTHQVAWTFSCTYCRRFGDTGTGSREEHSIYFDRLLINEKKGTAVNGIKNC